MRVLVTGATGFIGQNLVKVLLDNSFDVHTIVRENSGISVIDSRAAIFHYDTNIENLLTYCDRHKFDGIIHLASLFLASHTPKEISTLISSNITFGTHLLEAAKHSDIRWFISTGTFWQHYEDEAYNPVNLYAATKEAFETISKYYIETSNIVFTTIKLNDTFGPNDTRNKVFNLWNSIAKSGETLGMSAGEQTIDISYIDDVISAYIQLIKLLELDADTYNNVTFVISNKERVTLKELATIFEEATQTQLNITWGAREYREREVMSPFTQGKSVPGWEQQYTLTEAIHKTVKEL